MIGVRRSSAKKGARSPDALRAGASNRRLSGRAASIVIPHLVMPGALEPSLCDSLLTHAIGERARSQPGKVAGGSSGHALVAPDVRKVMAVHGSSEITAAFARLVDGWLPGVRASLGMRPAGRGDIEVSMVAYGDGDHYVRHIDTYTGTAASGPPREITFVGYFFREPRGFTGGALRLFDIHGREHVDIEPTSGLVTAFPSWLPHEVLPVSCPTGAFADSRFAVNIWVLKKQHRPTRPDEL
jgi:SM-20-related protein